MLFGFYFKPASQRQRGTDVSCERCLSSLAARFDDLAAVWSVYLSFRHKRTLAERRRPDPVWKSSVNCSFFFWMRVCFDFCVSVCGSHTHAGNTLFDLRPFSNWWRWGWTWRPTQPKVFWFARRVTVRYTLMSKFLIALREIAFILN